LITRELGGRTYEFENNSVADTDDLKIFRNAHMNRVYKSAFSTALSSWGYSDVCDEFPDVFGLIYGDSHRREPDEWNVDWKD